MKGLLILLVALVGAWAEWVQMEADVRVGRTHPDWAPLGAADSSHSHDIIFALKHDAGKLRDLEHLFWNVSDPRNPNYGKYLTFEELGRLMSAPKEHIDIVTAYLDGFGVTYTINPNQDMITAQVPVGTTEKMLKTKLGLFERKRDHQRLVRALQPYYLPAEVAAAVDLVGNLLDFPRWFQPKKVEAPGATGNWPDYCGASCHGQIVPQVMAQKYGINQTTPNAKNSMAVAEFQGQHYDSSDLNTFTTACGLPQVTVVDKLSPNSPTDCSIPEGCIESLLDIEYIHSLGPNSFPVNDYWLNTYSLLDWINAVLADPAASLVHSVSYGNDEAQQTSTAYMNSCNTQFHAAGVKGLSILFAAGDQGVWGREGKATGTFNPDFPAGSPYITAVGGTDFTGTSITSTEQCSTYGGGGFSITFTQPSYQTTAVNAYLTNPSASLPASNLYNAKGRAYPDVSATFGSYIPYCMREASTWVGVEGTSASCPVVASVMTHLNNIQLNNGKAPLGFLNPWIYQTYQLHPDAFTDITSGRNTDNMGGGFLAIAGWDPCSGVGTPNQNALAGYLP
jgi:tripeptidyl-peptidase-1